MRFNAYFPTAFLGIAGYSAGAMSQENVEIVRRLFAELQRGNFWVPEFFDPNVRVRYLDAVGTESETVGLQEMSDFMKGWLENLDDLALVAERVVGAGDQVAVVSAWKGRGNVSGVGTEWRHGAGWTVRDGLVVSVISYPQPGEALEAVGLAE